MIEKQDFDGFFRQSLHLGILRDECATWAGRAADHVRVWCADAATGEELYTLAMTLAESLDQHGVCWTLVASDVCGSALCTAAQGIYERQQLESVSPALRQRYFEAEYCDEAGRRTRRVVPELRSHIRFERLSLTTPPSSMRGELDAVFCRNLPDRAGDAVKQRLLTELERLLKPGGLLVLANTVHRRQHATRVPPRFVAETCG